MARVVNLECDKCGLLIKNDCNRITMWPHRIKFTKYDIVQQVYCDNKEVYLCGSCAKAFYNWLKEK